MQVGQVCRQNSNYLTNWTTFLTNWTTLSVLFYDKGTKIPKPEPKPFWFFGFGFGRAIRIGLIMDRQKLVEMFSRPNRQFPPKARVLLVEPKARTKSKSRKPKL
mgnify:CR=1 FL=1